MAKERRNTMQIATQQKDNPNLIADAQFYTPGQPVYSPKNYTNFIRQGYRKNPAVYRCVQIIAEAAAGISFKLYDGLKKKNEIEEHPILDLLHRPNEEQAQADFVAGAFSYLHLSGNSYIYAIKPSRNVPPAELWNLRPDKMKVIPGTRTIQGYEFGANSDTKLSLRPDEVMHIKFFSGNDDIYGLAPIEVAGNLIDQQNEGRGWNTALLQNSARPSGALFYKGVMDKERLERTREQIWEKIQGKQNAGRPLLLDGEMSWQQMSMTPAEIDWFQSNKQLTREICMSFGVPPELIGDGEQKTYSNFSEARQYFYIETVLPRLDLFRDRLNAWLVPMFGEKIYLDYDKNDIEAIRENENNVLDRAVRMFQMGFATMNEARTLMGLPELPTGNVVLENKSFVPVEDIGKPVPPQIIMPAETITETIQEASPDASGSSADGLDNEDDAVQPKKPKKAVNGFSERIQDNLTSRDEYRLFQERMVAE